MTDGQKNHYLEAVGIVSVKFGDDFVPIYRGGNDLTATLRDVKLNKKTGLIETTHGISLNVDQDKLSKFGDVYRIDYVPDGLKIEQRGQDLGHFEIKPTKPMSLDEYQNLLNQIKLSPI